MGLILEPVTASLILAIAWNTKKWKGRFQVTQHSNEVQHC